jgi:hypothetical protein
MPETEKEVLDFRSKHTIDETIFLDDYLAPLDALLFECGFSQMYPGNPYDWVFLFCSINSRPLDVFRGLMAEVLNEDE